MQITLLGAARTASRQAESAGRNGGYRTLTTGVSIALCDRQGWFGRDSLLLGEDPRGRWLGLRPSNMQLPP